MQNFKAVLFRRVPRPDSPDLKGKTLKNGGVTAEGGKNRRRRETSPKAEKSAEGGNNRRRRETSPKAEKSAEGGKNRRRRKNRRSRTKIAEVVINYSRGPVM